MDIIVKKLMEQRHINEDFDPMFDEDLKRYKGKALKELLKALDGKVRINLDLERPSHYGVSGFGGRCNGVTWEYADLVIKDIRAGDRKYVDVYVEL